MNERFLEHIKTRATELAADYPFRPDADEWEYLYAITASFEGTNLANDDLHKLLKEAGVLLHRLCRKLPQDDHARLDAQVWCARYYLIDSNIVETV